MKTEGNVIFGHCIVKQGVVQTRTLESELYISKSIKYLGITTFFQNFPLSNYIERKKMLPSFCELRSQKCVLKSFKIPSSQNGFNTQFFEVMNAVLVNTKTRYLYWLILQSENVGEGQYNTVVIIIVIDLRRQSFQSPISSGTVGGTPQVSVSSPAVREAAQLPVVEVHDWEDES